MPTIIEKSKELFYKMITDFRSDPFGLAPHVPEVEKWAKYLLKKFPEADSEIVLISVWLHDVGHYPIPTEMDHAVRGEKVAQEFLEKNDFNKEKIEKVLHCIRAHRCKDMMPESIEAKIVAAADSASHMTDTIYLDMSKNYTSTSKDGKDIPGKSGDVNKALEKLERDYRDISLFPGLNRELKPLYEAWKRLLNEYKKLDI